MSDTSNSNSVGLTAPPGVAVLVVASEPGRALLDVVDVYLASFPHSGGHSLLEAMGAGKPVVVLRFPPDSHYNSGAELVGLRELTAPGEADYIEIADRLLRNPSLRQKQSQAMLDRFRAEFRPERLGERYKEFLAPFQGAIPK